MLRNLIRAAGVFAVCTPFVLQLPAQAGDTDVPINVETISARIDLAGRQRMLVERAAKFFCFARSGVNATAMVQDMVHAKTLFEDTHLAFREGSTEMQLFAEGDLSVVQSWEQVDLMWLSLGDVYNRALSGELVNEKDFDRAMRLTLEVRKRANDMVAQLRSAYADQMGDSGFGDALLLDLYGRQRMLSQKLSKEVCLVARGHKLNKTPPELQETLKLFESSLRAFIEGMPIAGVPKPPTEEIAEQLRLANGIWQEVRLTAATVASGNAVSLVDLETFATQTDRFLAEMNTAVKMLAKVETPGA